MYDGDSLVQTVDLSVGTNSVKFTNLTPNTLYQYAVVALYDDLSGTGIALNYLYLNAVYTDTIVLFDNITVGQEDITFSYSWYEGYTAAAITKLTLTADGKTQELTSTDLSATNLLSNTEYVLTAYYTNLDGQTESISLTFTTLEKATPTVEISTLTSEQESIAYALTITDTDGVGALTSVTLSLGEVEKATATTSTGSFTGLLSNNTYTVTVVYTYDLNDGNGNQTAKATKDITTQEKATPVVVIDDLTSTQTTVDYELAITDTDNVGTLTSVTLTLNGEEKDTATTSTGSFTGLLSNNTYTVTVVYTYNLNDGNGSQTAKATKDITTEAKATPVVVIDDLTSTQTEVNYTLAITDTDGVGTLTSVTLSLNGEEKDTATTTTGSFTGLLSNNTYTVTVVYTYNLNDGNGNQIAKATKDITTEAKATPTVVIYNMYGTQTTIEYDLVITDTDGVGSLTSVTLTQDENVKGTLTTASGSFTGLYSGNPYTFTYVYTYNLNDGNGEQTISTTMPVVTKAKATPTVDIEHVDSDTTSLSFNITLTDEDNVGEITAVGLYSGDTLVEEVTDLSQTQVTFTGLDSEIQYTLKVSYKYDLNDGFDERTASKTVSAYTSFVVGFESFTILNTSAVSEGETIVVQADMYNPGNVTFTAIVVDGQTYEVSSVSTYKKIRAEIKNDGQFEGGNTAIIVSQLICTLNGKTYTVDVTTGGNIAYVFINGELTVNDISVVHLNDDGDYEETYYGFRTEQLYYKLDLSNATCYDVYSVTIGDITYDSDDIIMSDDYQTAYIAINYAYVGWNECKLSSISYSNSSLDKTKLTDIYVYYLRLEDDTIYEVTCADDLLNMNYYRYYKLMNDIDLSGYEWANMDNTLSGVFDGNGYSIKNMSAVTTYSDTSLYLGLFKYLGGVVVNLNITDALYIITVNNTTNNSYNIYAGGIAADAGTCVINNCNIDISIQLTNNNTGGLIDIGGVVGNINSSYLAIKNIEIAAVISVTSESEDWAYFGGIAGYMYSWQRTTISDLDISLTANISANYYYYANAYFGQCYYNGTWYSSDNGINIKNSTVDFKITQASDNIVYYGVDGFKFSYQNGEYTLVGYYGNDTDITLPDSVYNTTYSIGNSAFNGTKVNSITIPYTITSFDESAFNGCTAEIIWGENYTITEISKYAFAGYQGESITIPDSVTTIGQYAFNACTAKIIWGENCSITQIGKYAFAGYRGESLTIPSSVTTLVENAFNGCTAVIEWSENCAITTIDSWVFSWYYGTSLIIPESVTTINSHAFYGCTAEIIWSENSSITEISSWVFTYYGAKTITIPDYIITISGYAFSGSESLTSIIISDSVKTIGDYAFDNCTALKTVYYCGTESEWSAITIGNNNDYLTSATIYYFSETEPTESGNYWHYNASGEAEIWS